MIKDIADTPGKKIIKLNPGDIIADYNLSGKEVGRYIVLTKQTQGINANYYYTEYNCYIIYGDPNSENYLGGLSIPGQKWILDSVNLIEGDGWEIVSQSGLSWDEPHKLNK